jgi:parallel beta-helix repeat protein
MKSDLPADGARAKQIEAYEGDEPYLFVCYSRQDAAQVLADMQRLQQAGVRLWYDEGIIGGNRWREAIARAVTNCAQLLVFLSATAVKSKHVRREIALADELEKPLLAVRLCEAAIPAELRLILQERQWIEKWKMAPEQYQRAVLKALHTSVFGEKMAKSRATFVVDAVDGGDYRTVTAAVAAAEAGATILVRPGLYRESILVNKPVQIVGDGQREDIVIEATGRPVVRFTVEDSRMAGLTLRQAGGGMWFGVDISSGRHLIEDCDISSQSLACVSIRDGANPTLRGNRIHDGKQAGLYIYDGGKGIIEDNDIFGNAFAGAEIKTGANPNLRGNRIYDGAGAGVLVHENGLGALERNEIRGSALAGVEICTGANPTLRGNRIYGGKTTGVLIHNNGTGVIENNFIFSNSGAGVTIVDCSNAAMRRNRITLNGFQAIWIHNGGAGTFLENELRGNDLGAWLVEPDCLANVIRAGNTE